MIGSDQSADLIGQSNQIGQYPAAGWFRPVTVFGSLSSPKAVESRAKVRENEDQTCHSRWEVVFVRLA